MNNKKCEICGYEYSEFFEECPNCKKNNNENSNSSIIFDNSLDDDLSLKEDIINRRNQSIKNTKKVKKNNNLYSYSLLVMGMILLFIIIFSSLLEFSLIPFVHYILTVLLLFISFSLVYQEKEIGYYTTMLSSFSMILMICERDFISFLIGLYIFVCSFRYLVKK